MRPRVNHFSLRFIAAHPDFRYLDELRHTLAHGWVEQETTGRKPSDHRPH